jgi:hypothetical protein
MTDGGAAGWLQEEAAAEQQVSCDVSARFRWVPMEEVRAEADPRCHVPQVINTLSIDLLYLNRIINS